MSVKNKVKMCFAAAAALALLTGSVHAGLTDGDGIFDVYTMSVETESGFVDSDTSTSSDSRLDLEVGEDDVLALSSSIGGPARIQLALIGSMFESFEVTFSDIHWLDMPDATIKEVQFFDGGLPPNSIKLGEDGHSFTASWSSFEGSDSGNFLIAANKETVIPEPSTYALLGSMALVGLLLQKRRQKA